MFKLVLPTLFLLILRINAQIFFNNVGYPELQAQEGLATPNGAGIVVGQVEAQTVDGNYIPNIGSPQFSGKTITDVTGSSGGASGHANQVANIFYGNTDSIASGVTIVNAYLADDYLLDGGLNTDSDPSVQPLAFSEMVMNHSYVGSFGNAALDSEALRRFDYSIARDNTLAVVGLNNNPGSNIPSLLASNYNGISVGVTDGGHSSGLTVIEGAGRVKPDLVAPSGLTSYGTPMVSASAAVLLSSSHSTANYEEITSQKAVLMAGATKEGELFEGLWSRTDAQSLDTHYGAGEVNVFNSFNILAAGEQGPGLVDENGWDLADITTLVDNTYSFTIDPAHLLTEFSAMLTWNREVDNTDFLSATVSNLRLELTDSMGNSIQLADSAVDNVEHIYINPGIAGAALSAGTYNLVVSSSSGDSPYSLAWRSEIIEVIPVPEPTSVILITFGCLGFFMRRSRN